MRWRSEMRDTVMEWMAMEWMVMEWTVVEWTVMEWTLVERTFVERTVCKVKGAVCLLWGMGGSLV